MPRPALGPSFALCAGLSNLMLAASLSCALAQTAPETLRINVEPAKPGIRSITINRKYRPIISRDDAGVVIDTMGSDSALPPCEIDLQVTLENSRVLNRQADICSGNTLVVDVNNDGKPGSARVIGGTSGSVSAPAAPNAPAATTRTERPAAETTPARETTPGDRPALVTETDQLESREPEAPEEGAAETGILKPLERVDINGQGAETSGTPGLDPDNQTSGQPGIIADQSGYTISPSEDRVWNTTTGFGPGSRTDLIHGVPETDDVDFRAACLTQSGQATVVFSQTSSSLAQGLTAPVRISAGDFSASYDAIGGGTNNQYGQSFPQVVLPMTDPLWQALIAQSELLVEVEGLPPYSVSLKGSAQPVRLFVATCAAPQTIIGEENGFGSNQTVAVGADASCSEAGRIRSLDGNQPGQIVFRNTSQSTVVVHWIDYNGGERAYARLEPGQILEQQTYVSHAWLVRSASGQCLGIYVTRTPYREVVISGGNAPAQPAQQPFSFPQEQVPAGPVPPGTIGGGFSQAPVQSSASVASAQVADYLCTAGVDLQVSFSPDGSTATVAEMGQGVVTLPRQGGASSFTYSAQGFTLSGQIQNATWTRPGLRDVFCARR